VEASGHLDQHRDHEIRISKLEQWRGGNGARGAESRLQTVEDNYVSAGQLPDLVHSVMRLAREDEKKSSRADWNKWVNTGLLLIAVIGIFLQIFGVV